MLILPRRNIKNNVISRYVLNTIMGQTYSVGNQGPSRARPLLGLPFVKKMRDMYTIVVSACKRIWKVLEWPYT